MKKKNIEKMKLKHQTDDPIKCQTYSSWVNQQAALIWINTLNKLLETTDKNNNSEELVESFVKSANLAAKSFIEKFGK